MLLAVFAAVGLGVLAPNYKGRWGRLAVLIPIILTVAYYVRPQYMT
jgi:hypothetical protein